MSQSDPMSQSHPRLNSRQLLSSENINSHYDDDYISCSHSLHRRFSLPSPSNRTKYLHHQSRQRRHLLISEKRRNHRRSMKKHQSLLTESSSIFPKNSSISKHSNYQNPSTDFSLCPKRIRPKLIHSQFDSIIPSTSLPVDSSLSSTPVGSSELPFIPVFRFTDHPSEESLSINRRNNSFPEFSFISFDTKSEGILSADTEQAMTLSLQSKPCLEGYYSRRSLEHFTVPSFSMNVDYCFLNRFVATDTNVIQPRIVESSEKQLNQSFLEVNGNSYQSIPCPKEFTPPKIIVPNLGLPSDIIAIQRPSVSVILTNNATSIDIKSSPHAQVEDLKESSKLIKSQNESLHQQITCSVQIDNASTPDQVFPSKAKSTDGFDWDTDIPKAMRLPPISMDNTIKPTEASSINIVTNSSEDLTALKNNLRSTHLIPVSSFDRRELEDLPKSHLMYYQQFESPSLPPANPTFKSNRRSNPTGVNGHLSKSKTHQRFRRSVVPEPYITSHFPQNTEYPKTGNTTRVQRKRARSEFPSGWKTTSELSQSQRSRSLARQEPSEAGSRIQANAAMECSPKSISLVRHTDWNSKTLQEDSRSPRERKRRDSVITRTSHSKKNLIGKNSILALRENAVNHLHPSRQCQVRKGPPIETHPVSNIGSNTTGSHKSSATNEFVSKHQSRKRGQRTECGSSRAGVPRGQEIVLFNHAKYSSNIELDSVHEYDIANKPNNSSQAIHHSIKKGISISDQLFQLTDEDREAKDQNIQTFELLKSSKTKSLRSQMNSRLMCSNSSDPLMLWEGTKPLSPRLWDINEFPEATFRAAEPFDMIEPSSSPTLETTDSGVMGNTTGKIMSLHKTTYSKKSLLPLIIQRSNNNCDVSHDHHFEHPITPPYHPSQSIVDIPFSKLPANRTPPPAIFPVSPLTNSVITASQNTKATSFSESLNANEAYRFVSPVSIPSKSLTSCSADLGLQHNKDIPFHVRAAPTHLYVSHRQRLSSLQKIFNSEDFLSIVTSSPFAPSKDTENGLTVPTVESQQAAISCNDSRSNVSPIATVPKSINPTFVQEYQSPTNHIVDSRTIHSRIEKSSLAFTSFSPTSSPPGSILDEGATLCNVPNGRHTTTSSSMVEQYPIFLGHAPAKVLHNIISASDNVSQGSTNPLGATLSGSPSSGNTLNEFRNTVERSSAPSSVMANEQFGDDALRYRTPLKSRNSISRNTNSNPHPISVITPIQHQSNIPLSQSQITSPTQPWTIPRNVTPTPTRQAPSWVNSTNQDCYIHPCNIPTMPKSKPTSQSSPLGHASGFQTDDQSIDQSKSRKNGFTRSNSSRHLHATLPPTSLSQISTLNEVPHHRASSTSPTRLQFKNHSRKTYPDNKTTIALVSLQG